MSVNPTPAGYHTVTPYLIVADAAKEVEFIVRAFDAVEIHRSTLSDGTIMHVELRIGDSIVMLGQARGDMKPMPAMLHLYVADCIAIYRRALWAGAVSLREPADQFYGDRSGGVVDAEGIQWWIATHIEEVSEKEIRRRVRALAG